MVFVLLTASSVAQPPEVLWERTYGGGGDEIGYAVKALPDGFVIAGTSTSFGDGSNDMYLVRLDGNGDTLWCRTYAPRDSSYDEALDVAVTNDGGFILAGQTYYMHTDVYVVKTNSEGQTEWSRTYGGGGAQWARVVKQTQDGGYVLAGYTNGSGHESGDMYLIKINAAGQRQWERFYDQTGYDLASGLDLLPDGGIALCGPSTPPSDDQGGILVIRADANGDTLWTRRYGAEYYSAGVSAIRVHPTLGFVLACSFDPTPNLGDNGGLVIATDSVGETLWSQTYVFAGENGFFNALDMMPNGNIVLTGLFGTFLPDYDLVVFCANQRGDSLWSIRAGETNDFEEGFGIAVAGYYGCLVVGKVDYSWPNLSGDDIYTIRIAGDSLNALERGTPLARKHDLSNYPNPFNGETTIAFTLRTEEQVELSVSDILGRQVSIQLCDRLPGGQHTLVFNARDLASGIYFIQLQSGKSLDTRKMVCLK